ncbi:hypothetical protein DP163_gp022 [Sea otter poxvirus]|uniref:Uncharacterized protein n=1 Tax=Sea otter poxvirus TaxID=1416741 RepID=A0A2U9QHL5_9POXV|nr:hypothetical protein DP163_gp022 [Sea otter poxvirus]AWU47067.1 hypothetical protein [Sea otter poxvirus]
MVDAYIVNCVSSILSIPADDNGDEVKKLCAYLVDNNIRQSTFKLCCYQAIVRRTWVLPQEILGINEQQDIDFMIRVNEIRNGLNDSLVLHVYTWERFGYEFHIDGLFRLFMENNFRILIDAKLRYALSSCDFYKNMKQWYNVAEHLFDYNTLLDLNAELLRNSSIIAKNIADNHNPNNEHTNMYKHVIEIFSTFTKMSLQWADLMEYIGKYIAKLDYNKCISECMLISTDLKQYVSIMHTILPYDYFNIAVIKALNKSLLLWPKDNTAIRIYTDHYHVIKDKSFKKLKFLNETSLFYKTIINYLKNNDVKNKYSFMLIINELLNKLPVTIVTNIRKYTSAKIMQRILESSNIDDDTMILIKYVLGEEIDDVIKYIYNICMPRIRTKKIDCIIVDAYNTPVNCLQEQLQTDSLLELHAEIQEIRSLNPTMSFIVSPHCGYTEFTITTSGANVLVIGTTAQYIIVTKADCSNGVSIQELNNILCNALLVKKSLKTLNTHDIVIIDNDIVYFNDAFTCGFDKLRLQN